MLISWRYRHHHLHPQLHLSIVCHNLALEITVIAILGIQYYFYLSHLSRFRFWWHQSGCPAGAVRYHYFLHTRTACADYYFRRFDTANDKAGLCQNFGLFCTELFSPDQTLQGLHKVPGNRKVLSSYRSHLWKNGHAVSVRFLGGSSTLHDMVRPKDASLFARLQYSCIG